MTAQSGESFYRSRFGSVVSSLICFFGLRALGIPRARREYQTTFSPKTRSPREGDEFPGCNLARSPKDGYHFGATLSPSLVKRKRIKKKKKTTTSHF